MANDVAATMTGASTEYKPASKTLYFHSERKKRTLFKILAEKAAPKRKVAVLATGNV